MNAQLCSNGKKRFFVFHELCASNEQFKSTMRRAIITFTFAVGVFFALDSFGRRRGNRASPLVVVVTGGPCGGKTTSLVKLQLKLASVGLKGLIVPEVATLLMKGGANFACSTSDKRVEQQAAVLRTMIVLEDDMHFFAKHEESRCVILCDRGALDGSAYCSVAEWEKVLTIAGLTTNDLLSRYTAVIHLVTTAIGAPMLYTRSNNDVRRESAAEAAQADLATRNVWQQHPDVTIVENKSIIFDEKVDEVFRAILRLVESN